MKRCVYCGLDIDDEAIVCRYCTRQIPLDAVTLDYPGQRFGLGRTQTSYALWDLTSSTPPLAEFTLTEQGWGDAWFRFQQMEKELGGAPNTGAPSAVTEGAPIYPQFPLGPQAPEPPEGRGYTTAAWIFAGLAVFILPIIFGPVGMVLGAVARSKGDPRGTRAIFLALGGMILGFVLAYLAYSSGLIEAP